MGEANDIAKLLGMNVEFSASKEGDELLIHYTSYTATAELPGEDGEQQQQMEKIVITMKDFQREYRKLRRMQTSVKNTLAAKPLEQKAPAISQNTIVSGYTLGKIDKKLRQEQLRDVLQETMKLTNKLKEQLRILERNGVTGT